jgi:hypothetical protein
MNAASIEDTPLGRFRKLRADVPEDVQLLAEAIDQMGTHIRPLFCAAVLTEGLMKPINLSMRLGAWISRKRGLEFEFYQAFFKGCPEEANNFIGQIAEHVLYGKDLISSRSVGGWCQAEVDKCIRIFMGMAEAVRGADGANDNG